MSRFVQLAARYIGVALVLCAGWLGGSEEQKAQAASYAGPIALALAAVVAFFGDLLIHWLKGKIPESLKKFNVAPLGLLLILPLALAGCVQPSTRNYSFSQYDAAGNIAGEGSASIVGADSTAASAGMFYPNGQPFVQGSGVNMQGGPYYGAQVDWGSRVMDSFDRGFALGVSAAAARLGVPIAAALPAGVGLASGLLAGLATAQPGVTLPPPTVTPASVGAGRPAIMAATAGVLNCPFMESDRKAALLDGIAFADRINIPAVDDAILKLVNALTLAPAKPEVQP